MNKKQSKRRRDIKSKLMAAICMLLVSSIMMVSTTYAWFTLSTAPEVTGINTAVGANGNLEMALQPYDGNSQGIVSGTSDSMATQDVEDANITWGNLVSLKGKDGSDIYGMDRITLYPAALNVNPGTTIIGENPLATPEYGADGRVSALVTKTITGVWNGEGFTEDIDGESAPILDAKGVRAIGVSSGMSDRQLAYRAAMASASTADSQARSMASSSLDRNGASLADVAIAHALKNDANDAAVYTKEQVASMRATLNDLVGYGEGEAHVTGSLEFIKNALLNFILADTLAGASDEGYSDIVTAFSSVTLENVTDNATFQASATKFSTYITQLNTAITAAETAKSKLPTGDGPFTWNQISDALGGLVNTTYLEINDMPVGDVMADPGSAAGSILKNGLTLTMKSGAGVYADIADFCGNYSASIIIPELTYPGVATVPNVEATMATKTDKNPVHLKAAQAAVTPFTASTGGSSSASISDFYGYIIDLAFRTNAADSYLQLQSTAIDRVYAGNEQNEATMGGGAYMKFTSASDKFTQEAMKRLMGAIRIVFFKTDEKDVIGYARLNTNAVDPDTSTGVKMPLMMTDAAGNALVDDTTTAQNETVAIMALDQNVVHELSVMVYLDGEVVGNDDVAYDTAKSMTGSMNLQFSSSATLVPMEYTDLRTGTGETTPAATETELTNVTSEVGSTGVTVGAAYLSADGDEIAIQLNNYSNQTVTVKIGDAEAVSVTPTTVEGYTGFTVDAPADFVANTTAIVVTVTAAASTT